MAVFKFSAGQSIVTNAAGGTAFNQGTAGADTLLVNAGANLIASDAAGIGATLSGPGAWTATVSGDIWGGAGGLFIDQNIAGTSKVTITKSGSLGGNFGLAVGSSTNVSNAGTISAVALLANAQLANSGVIENSIFVAGADTFVIQNSGTIGVNVGTFSIIDNTQTTKSTTIVNTGSLAAGIGLADGNDLVRNSGMVGELVDLGDGANTLVNSGTINGVYIGGSDSDVITNNKVMAANVGLGDGDNRLTNSGQIGFSAGFGNNSNADVIGGAGADTLVNSGTITGTVIMGNGSNSLRNSGVIGSSPFGGLLVQGGADADNVTNTGTIYGDVRLGNGENIFLNRGTVRDSLWGVANTGNYAGGAGKDTVTNSNTIAGSVLLGDGTNALTNSGTIGGLVGGGSGSDTILNRKSIGSSVTLGDGTNSLTNSGTIGLDVNNHSVIGGKDDDRVTNSKLISGIVDLGDGDNTFVNSGIIQGKSTTIVLGPLGEQFIHADVILGNGDDTVVNSGTINGGLSLGDGDNTVTNSGLIRGGTFGQVTGGIVGGAGIDVVTNTGTVRSAILLFGGDDIYTGSKSVDLVVDGDGSDLIKLGAGDDGYGAVGAILGLDGADTIDGGAGVDTYDASGATTKNTINLDTVVHSNQLQNAAFGTDISFAFGDRITNFENAIGGSAEDDIYGTSAANRLEGRNGTDLLAGYGANDVLDGGNGNDTLEGGAGADTLTGGADADQFVFVSFADSGLTKPTRDLITDFASGIDKIDVAGIDAVSATAIDDSFQFIGVNVSFTKAAGELRVIFGASGQLVEGDTNGDGKADFAIEIADAIPQVIALGANDFLL